MSESLPLSAYLQNLGFERNPFPVTPDEHGIFFSPQLAEQFTELLHFIEQRKGFMLVTGDVGVGKSTLARALLTRLAEQGACTALVFNTFLQGADLLRAINRDFGAPAEGASLEALLQALNTWLLLQHEEGRNCVLILDDAQGLDVPSLELVRQLSNLEASQAKLLQIVMVAQPEIRLTLNRHDMRQLASRIALRLELSPLTVSELDIYLHHRLRWAGRAGSLTVDRRALRRLHRYSFGYIRRVHILLDRCLYGLVTSGTKRITASLVDIAAKELSLKPAKGRSAYRSLLVGGAAAASVTGILVAANFMAPDYLLPTLNLNWTVSSPVTEVTPMPASVLPQPAEQQRAAEWQAFAERHAPLPLAEDPPQHWSDVAEWLPLRSDGQPWVALLLPNNWESGCHNQPLYSLAEGKLALFRSSLPVEPQPFGAESESIVALQRSLVESGVFMPEVVDGVMGPRTANALAQFQKQSGLLASGQPDEETAYLLGCLSRGGA